MIENGTVGQNAAVLESNHGDEESDAHGNGVLQGCGHHVEDNLSHVAQAEHHKQYTFNEYGSECKLPRVSQ